MHILVVHNPVAGRTRPEALREILRRNFHSDHFELSVYETTGEDDITSLVREHVLAGVELVVAAGGDGTVSAVADALANGDVPLGILPAGTTNVVAQELGIPLNIERACRVFTGKYRYRSIDAIRYEDCFYIHSVGTGLSAQAMLGASRERKRRYGLLAYIWSILKIIVGIQPHNFTIMADGNIESFQAADVMLANISILTKPFRLGPHIAPDDGRVDICITRARSIFDIIGVALDILLQGQMHRPRNLIFREAYDSVKVTSDRPVLVQGDGEVLGQTPIEVTVIKGAVKIIVPAD